MEMLTRSATFWELIARRTKGTGLDFFHGWNTPRIPFLILPYASLPSCMLEYQPPCFHGIPTQPNPLLLISGSSGASSCVCHICTRVHHDRLHLPRAYSHVQQTPVPSTNHNPSLHTYNAHMLLITLHTRNYIGTHTHCKAILKDYWSVCANPFL